MGLTTKLAEELTAITTLEQGDIEALHTLIIDFFAASFAGYRQNRPFNEAVEAVILEQGGAPVSSVSFSVSPGSRRCT